MSVTDTPRPAVAGEDLRAGSVTDAGRDPATIVRAILDETQLLLKKHVELVKLELKEAAEARAQGVAALIFAGVIGLFALGFLASAAAYGLAVVMPDWLARLIVGVVFLLVAGGAAFYGLARMQKPPMAPEATRRTIKEDAEWARTQLKR